eukprot:scaffold41507_cov292-Skeletonema_marinoi.AAC.1
MTEGWQYLTFTDCNDDGWVGFGQGGSVDVDIKYKGKIGYASPSQNELIFTSYHVGNVGEEATNACCSPEPG